MDKKNKKKYYYTNNKKYYTKKKKKEEKMTYDKIVDARKSVDELEDNVKLTYSNNSIIAKMVAISVIIIAIVFSSLLLFHLI